MYLVGRLELDPRQLTQINRIKPTKAFGRLLYFLTAGNIADKEEEETFTAVSILQELNMGLRNMGITNIVRLAKDDYDFYLDEEGRHDDLKEAMERFGRETDRYEAELFDTLYLMVEHQEGSIKYLISVEIQRSHPVGQFPIAITINGLPAQLSPTDSAAEAKENLAPIFASQQSYDAFQDELLNDFDQFILRLRHAIEPYIRIDDVKMSTETQIIRPDQSLDKADQIPHNRQAPPVFHGYWGFDSLFFYSWMWSDMAYAHSIHLSNVNVVDHDGGQLFEVGDNGIDAGDGDTFNTETAYEQPTEGDITFADGETPKSEESGWLDSFGGDSSSDTSDSSSSSDSGGSSCSSCSSCGGD